MEINSQKLRDDWIKNTHLVCLYLDACACGPDMIRDPSCSPPLAYMYLSTNMVKSPSACVNILLPAAQI